MHRYNPSAPSRASVTRRIICYCVLFFTLGVAQCSFFANLSFISVVPNIVLGAVVAISLLDSQRCAIVCAIGAGAMIDALGGAGLSLSPLVFMAIAMICSEIAKKMLPSFPSWVILLIPAVMLHAAFTLARLALSFNGFTLSSVLKNILIPEAILTLIISLPIFFLVKLCVRISDAKSKFKI